MKHCILTWENLTKRGMQGPYWCCMCKNDDETMKQLLDDSSFIVGLWDWRSMAFRRSDRVRQCPNEMLSKWSKNPFWNTIINLLWEMFSHFTLWEIWREQNTRIFQGNFKNEERVWTKLRSKMIEMVRMKSLDSSYWEATNLESSCW